MLLNTLDIDRPPQIIHCGPYYRGVLDSPSTPPPYVPSFDGGSSNASTVPVGDGLTGRSATQLLQRDGVAMRGSSVGASEAL